MTMALAENFRMNAGHGDTSYANNSRLQMAVLRKTRPFLEASIKDMFKNSDSNSALLTCLKVADLGCSSGPTASLVISEIVKIFYGICQQQHCKLPEIQAFLNDLPANDFNAIFRSVPAFCDGLKREMGADCYISGVPGSFYDGLFPSNTLQFIHSSYSLHWLSKVPENLENNRRNIYMGKTSPPNVFRAYAEQFKKDFSKFLGLRSQEMMPWGRMLLTFQGRSIADASKDIYYAWEIVKDALLDLVAEGLVKEADVDSFNLPHYVAYEGEVREIIEEEGSFAIDKLESFEIILVAPEDDEKQTRSVNTHTKSTRAVLESLLANHFGDAIMDSLFRRFAENMAVYLQHGQKPKAVSIVISLIKK
uniref:SABATH methyltransferase 4 n=1 Tax=Bixa orellana TaxID=66672 RepID=A0A9Y0ZEY4_BIXOR|nr:SABATH methyltransferase 4 [Bixa orellana]